LVDSACSTDVYIGASIHLGIGIHIRIRPEVGVGLTLGRTCRGILICLTIIAIGARGR
jgi:hypothetical protein